jgi:hypothetical protein
MCTRWSLYFAISTPVLESLDVSAQSFAESASLALGPAGLQPPAFRA